MSAAVTPLTIVILIEPTAWGGTELHTVALARTLTRRGHRVRIGLLNETFTSRFVQEAGPSVTVTCLNPDRAVGELTPSRWRRALQSVPGEVGIMAKSWLYSGSLSLDRAARRLFRTYLAIEHLTPPPRPAYRRGSHAGGLIPGVGFWWLERMGTLWLRARCARRIYTVSDAIRRDLVNHYGYPEERMVVARNGVDPDEFTPSPDWRGRARQSWGIPEGDVVFGTVCRLVNHHKGLDVAVAAFAELWSEGTDAGAWLVIAGDGPDRALLEAQARATRMADRILFTGHTDLPARLYPALDVLLMPSRFEGIGLSLMEGMACGCWPVASRTGGIPEVITDDSLGWLVPPGDAAALTSAMRAALALEPERRRALGLRARRHIVEHFDARTQFDTLASHIERDSGRHD